MNYISYQYVTTMKFDTLHQISIMQFSEPIDSEEGAKPLPFI